MIKSIEINNFLSHKKTYLELSSGLNIIVGPTDSGKSAIIRALKWLVWNRPVGDSYRSSWGGDTRVGIIVDNVCVTRVKSDKENQYFVGDIESEDYLEFNAIKTDVPEEIRKALNLNEINLQTQFESHFLLSKSAGEVASHFNKVAHLDRIDVGLFNVQKWLRKVQDSIKSSEEQIKELHTELAEFDNIQEIEDKIYAIECIDIIQKELVDKKAKGVELIIDLTNVNVEIDNLSELVGAEDIVLDLLITIDKVRLISIQMYELADLIEKIEIANMLIEEIEDIVVMEVDVDILLEIEKEEIRLESTFDEINDLMYNINYVEGKIESTEEELKYLEKEFHEYLGSGKICPLCGSVLK